MAPAIAAVIESLPEIIEVGSEMYKFFQKWQQNLRDKNLWTEEVEEAVVAKYGAECLLPEWQPRPPKAE